MRRNLDRREFIQLAGLATAGVTGHIPHHAAKGLMFPLPAPHSVPKKAPVPWDAANPYRGLGFRSVQSRAGGDEYALTEWPVEKS